MTTTPFKAHEVQRPGTAIASVRRPTSVAGVLSVLASDPSARVIAGGTDLLLDLQRGERTEPVTLIDVSRLETFDSITDVGDAFVLGGGVTHAQVIVHRGIADRAAPLAQACREVGSPQLRNRATLAGNLITASPANDTISALMALGASVTLSRLVDGSATEREVDLADFFTGFRSVDMNPDELLTEIRVPALATHQRGVWVKLGLRKAQAISVVHAGLVVSFDSELQPGHTDAAVTDAKLALGSVAPTVVLVPRLQQALSGRPIDSTSAKEAAAAATDAVEPISDLRATADYRSGALAVVLERALLGLAADNTGGSAMGDTPTLGTVAAQRGTQLAFDEETPVTIAINGEDRTAAGAVDRTLLDWVRNETDLTGVKEGCAEGECGACTLIMDGAAVMSCLVNGAQADGSAVTTVEALAAVVPSPLQEAFVSEFAVQCGFCIPGFIMSGTQLLTDNPTPTDDQIEVALSGNLCRCTGYYPIAQALRRAADDSA